MNPVISYLIELNIALTIFYLAYKLFFQKDSNFRIRRFFLLSALLLSAAMPFMHFSFPGNANGAGIPVFSLDEVIATGSGNQGTSENATGILNILATLYVAVSGYFLIRLLSGLFLIWKTRYTAKKHFIGNSIVYESATLHASSFFHLIFIDPKKMDHKETEQIVKHEQLHARLLHSFDRIMMEIILILAWFNPVTWFLRKAIIINHEYQADNRMIEQGTDQVSYQLTILNQYIGSASITNQFSNHIKNRIVMLNKNYKKGSFWKGIVLFPISILLLFFIACSNEENSFETSDIESLKKDIYNNIEVMPQWPGEDDFSKAIRIFIAQNVGYPTKAAKNSVQGKVMVSFIVTKTGEVVVVDDPEFKPSKGNLDEVVVVAYGSKNEGQEFKEEHIVLLKDEGKRVIEQIPDLIPGKKDGKPVNVLLTVPINFILQ